jgi:hypothetical protein
MALSSIFQPKTIATKKSEAQYKRWMAVYYTVRHLFWQDAKGRIFKDGVDRGILTPITPGIRKKDGSFTRPEYDSKDVQELYKEAWRQFEIEFEREYIKCTIEELVQIAQEYFGYDLEMIMNLNNQRLAEHYNR